MARSVAGSLTATAGGRTLTYDSARQLSSVVEPSLPAGAPPVTTTFTYDARGNRVSATADLTCTSLVPWAADGRRPRAGRGNELGRLRRLESGRCLLVSCAGSSL